MILYMILRSGRERGLTILPPIDDMDLIGYLYHLMKGNQLERWDSKKFVF